MAGWPFDDSRRLTGANLYFDSCAVVLEALGEVAREAAIVQAWRKRVHDMARHLGWPAPRFQVRQHATGTSLAFSAPLDQLYTATEVNEWALLGCLPAADYADLDLAELDGPPPGDDAHALQMLAAHSAAEAVPGLTELATAARRHGVNLLEDEDLVTLGSGQRAQSWPRDALPLADELDWAGFGDVPMALVTGSNGKTTTVRLLAAMLRAHGWQSAHSCTDGVFMASRALQSGDYSGPGGARAALRQPGIDAAVLETARGGLLRRGLAMQHADAAIVTNISEDHFGDYGIHDTDDLAEAKLVVAKALGPRGLLISNADDELLARHVRRREQATAWFALDDDHPSLQASRRAGGASCGVRAGQLQLTWHGARHDLGAVADMPLTAQGTARYNIANAAAAALAGAALGAAPAAIAAALARFGADSTDNPGRLQRWQHAGITVVLDFAHNPDGLAALQEVVEPLRGAGRLGLTLGHAGDRDNANLAKVAAAATKLRPERIILKEIAGYERGRAAGEVMAVLHQALVERGIDDARISKQADETEAARQLLAWAKPGDVLVLPILTTNARAQVSALLDAWQNG